MADDQRNDPDTPDDADDVSVDSPSTGSGGDTGATVRARSTMPRRRTDSADDDEDDVVATKRVRKPRPAHESERTGVVRFIQQCIDELRRVVWPTGDSWRQYFVVVLVFVVVMIAYASLLDLGFGTLMLWLFG